MCFPRSIFQASCGGAVEFKMHLNLTRQRREISVLLTDVLLQRERGKGEGEGDGLMREPERLTHVLPCQRKRKPVLNVEMEITVTKNGDWETGSGLERPYFRN